MSEQAKDKNKAQPPVEHAGLKLGKAKTTAAGVPSVTTALKHAGRHMRVGDALKVSFKLNQKGGIDCPGCAWPDPDDDRSRLGEYCENGMKAIAEEAQKNTIGADFFAQHSVAELGDWSDYRLGKAGRLAEPLVLREGGTHYEPISWEEAFAMVGQELNQLVSPNEAIFYTSGRTSNEAAFLYQLFVREYGTNNLPDCSNMCHESSGMGLGQTIGIGKGTVKLDDFYNTDLVIVVGQNPGTNHPRMLTALEKCKENGGQIMTINPLPEAGLMTFKNPQRLGKMLGGGTQLTDLFLPVAVNGDVALFKAIMLLLWHHDREKGGKTLDWDFITAQTEGVEAFIKNLRQQDFNTLAEASGVDRERIKMAAEMIRKADRLIICWAMGITQHENGVDNVKEIVNLLLLKGAFGRQGSGACPVRGHSNVQGDRTMGIWEAPKAAFLDKIQETFGFNPPREHGYATVDAIHAMKNGKAKVFFAMGGNFLSASPDTEFTAEALQECRLTVQVSTKLNRSHLIHGKTALILPCMGRTEIDQQAEGEQFVSVENSMGVVHMSKGVLSPCSPHILSEPSIVARLAEATLGQRSKVQWGQLVNNYDHIRDLIEKVIPGFERYNERVREPGGFYLPNGPREGRFTTRSGKAHFTVTAVPDNQLASDEYILMTVRSHDQFNTTIYGLDDRYRGVRNERRVVFMNKEDMASRGFKAKQAIDIINEHGGQQRIAENFLVIPYDIPKGCLAAYFPEANVLVPIDSYAKGSKTPASKRIVVKLKEVAS